MEVALALADHLVLWAVELVVVADSYTSPMFVPSIRFPLDSRYGNIDISQLPFNVGWQDLKDLFRGAGEYYSVITADLLTRPSTRRRRHPCRRPR